MIKPNQIAHYRKLRGLSQADLGKKVDAHPITISRLERGVMGLSVEWMERLAEPLGVKPHDLMANTEDKLAAMDAKLDAIVAIAQVNFRIPVELKDRLAIESAISGRTLTAEIVHRLERGLADNGDAKLDTIIDMLKGLKCAR